MCFKKLIWLICLEYYDLQFGIYDQECGSGFLIWDLGFMIYDQVCGSSLLEMLSEWQIKPEKSFDSFKSAWNPSPQYKQ